VPGLVVVRSAEEEQPQPSGERSAVFRVLEGNDRWLVLTDTAADDAPPSEEFYREIFRSHDARGVADSARFVYMIRIDVAPDLDHDAFNDWYDRKHVPEVAPAGLRRGKRYTSNLPGFPYMALYDMDARDTLESEALQKVRGFYEFTPQVTALERTVLERVS